ncbi:MAG: DMT family transporter [Candidatus Adiutrix sp.]|jgi:drug/metabolite transporter (DMT)-like permease|nr:DMT family transporter [Candidatus Adiutrix sp.]
MPGSDRDRSPYLIYGLLFLTMIFWGGTFVAGRLVALESPPLTGAFWRFLLAVLALWPFVRMREGGWRPRGLAGSGWLLLALMGFTGAFAYNYFFIKGLASTDAGRASVIVAANPCLTYAGAALFFGEKFTRRSLLGFACGLGGAAWAISHGQPWNFLRGGAGLGEILIFGCVVCWSGYSLLGKLALERLTPLMATTWACLFGLLCLLPAALLESGPWAFLDFRLSTWLSLAFLGFLGTALGFTWFYQGIARLGARRTVVFINLVPVFGLLSGWLLLGEKLSLSLAAGLVLVLTGISLIQRT